MEDGVQVAPSKSDSNLLLVDGSTEQQAKEARALGAFHDSVTSSKKVATPVLPSFVLNELDVKLKGGAKSAKKAAKKATQHPVEVAIPEPPPPPPAAEGAVPAMEPAPVAAVALTSLQAALAVDASQTAASAHAPSATDDEAAPLLPEVLTESNLVKRRSTPLYLDVVARLNSNDDTSRSILSRLDSLLGLNDGDAQRSARVPLPSTAAEARPPPPSETFCGGIFSCFRAGGGAE